MKLPPQSTENSIVATVLFVNLLATGASIIHPKIQDNLFEIYLGSITGLYGYVIQSRDKKDD